MSKGNKIKIRPFQPKVSLDAEYAVTTWNLLHNAIIEIYNKNASCLSFEELYRNAYNMVLHKYGDRLYNGLKDTVELHLKEVSEDVFSVSDENLLTSVMRAWGDHSQAMLMIRDILMYMDRVYVASTNLQNVYDLGLSIFRKMIARNEDIKDRMLNCLLEGIESERRGEVIDRGLFKNICSMLVDLGISSKSVYEEDFENTFLEVSAAFYHAESMMFISSNSTPEYIKKVKVRIDEEIQRVEMYLDSNTEKKILEVVEQEMISNHMNLLLHNEESGLIPMLKDDKIPDLRRVYDIIGRVTGGHDLMKEIISNYVHATGKEIVDHPENEKKPNIFVQSLIDLKDKYDRILSDAFGDDKQFIVTVNQSFESFINEHERSPEFISLFIDEKLRKGLKGATEDEVEDTLKKVMVLFRFIQEKDIFEKYYKQHLAKRLLLGNSVSDDAEKGMISKLKTECGYQFTNKLEGMFNDMRSSTTMMESYKEFLRSNEAPPGIDMNVSVLTTGYWPTQTSASYTLPQDVLSSCGSFESYYLSNHTGRKLTWQTNMGTAELRAFFPSKRHELNLSTAMMCILLQFANQDDLTFQQIKDETNIPVPDLKRNLFTLCCNQYRILLKEPRTKNFQPSDIFSFNKKFKSKLIRVKVKPVSDAENQRKVIKSKIQEDRKLLIEAAVVRVMKARNRVNHNNLVSEVIQQLSSRFHPHVNVIKKRIESLIDREYLERDANDRKTYVYLA